jgi:pimeloyl-ACP methyl ester carboxylesterase
VSPGDALGIPTEAIPAAKRDGGASDHTDPLRGLPQDSVYVHQFLTQNAALQGQPVVLVGHSDGGAVITNAAVGAPGIRALVYVDAFIPDEGDTIGGLASAEPGSCLGNEAVNPVPYPAHRPVTSTSTSSPRRRLG